LAQAAQAVPIELIVEQVGMILYLVPLHRLVAAAAAQIPHLPEVRVQMKMALRAAVVVVVVMKTEREVLVTRLMPARHKEIMAERVLRRGLLILGPLAVAELQHLEAMEQAQVEEMVATAQYLPFPAHRLHMLAAVEAGHILQ
jgi:hypothetical protein